MYDDRLIQLITQTVDKTPASAKLTDNAKSELVDLLYKQLEQQLSFVVLERLSETAQIQYLTMLQETLPQATVQEFLQENIPDIEQVWQGTVTNFINDYLAMTK